jgi:3',5'-cyclic AMP phosphodiesterase CpdA
LRTIAHISDLHFGAHDPRLAEGLLGDLNELNPTLVAVSGDLTQRARTGQFKAARAFMDRVTCPVLVVPGNHDIPLFDLVSRFWRPLHGYRRHITDDLTPSFIDAELAVLGLNTARSNTWKDGRISVAQMEVIRTRLCRIPPSVVKVLVTHHPFVPPPDRRSSAVVGRGVAALQAAEACGTDLVLAGHLHRGYSADVRQHHVTIRRSILVVQAGTAVSQRRRGEPNTYNVLTIALPELSVAVRAWDGKAFVPNGVTRYVKTDTGWQPPR